MAFTSFEKKEIHTKIVYFGPPGSGKTTNLRSIFAKTSPDMLTGNLGFADDPSPTAYFDFLPLSIGTFRDFHLKAHLYSLPRRGLYDSVRTVVLKGVDGFVFVADSRLEAMPDNLMALAEMRRTLSEHGLSERELSGVFQFNKRDAPTAVGVEQLRHGFNPTLRPDFEAVASQDKGTMETLQSMVRTIVEKLAGH